MDTSVSAETPFPLRKYFAEKRALNVFIRQACFCPSTLPKGAVSLIVKYLNMGSLAIAFDIKSLAIAVVSGLICTSLTVLNEPMFLSDTDAIL